MAAFKYTAVSEDGREVKGIVRASDREEAVMKIRETASVINSVAEVAETPDFLKKLKKIDEKGLAMVCKQFSIILEAGIPVVRAVQLVAAQSEDRVMKQLLTEVAEDVIAGHSVADSFELRDTVLPRTFIETLRAGEASGSLENAFARLSTYFSKSSRVRSKVQAALAYPVFVLIVAVVVIIIIMAKAVPSFTKSFEGMGEELPGVTRALIAVSDFMADNFLIILGLLAVLIAGRLIAGRTEKGRLFFAKLHLKLPILGKIELMNASGQFANTMATMTASGLTAVQALSVTGRTLSNAHMSESVSRVVEAVESGFRIGDAMKHENTFPELLQEMTAVGEEAGSLVETLTVIGEYYDNELEVATNKAVSLLEPVTIVFLAAIVIVILLAVYLPMFGMYGGLL